MAACSGAKFGEASNQTPGGGAGNGAQKPHNSSDEGSVGHNLDDLPVTPQGGAADAGAGGKNSGGAPITPVTVGASGDAGGSGGAAATCQHPIAEEWANALAEDGAWKASWGDPYVDVANRRLVVTYDDVATRSQAYVGGYYATAQVTLNGGTPLALYPYAKQGIWPSLRLNEIGKGLELGGTIYGVSESWHDSDWPNFSGVQVPGTRTASVTFYVKANQQAAAAKVHHNDSVWRSGWVTGPFTWDQTNLGIFRYVGENNSGVFDSADDTIFIGPVSGCQGLSDAEVQAEFDN